MAASITESEAAGTSGSLCRWNSYRLEGIYMYAKRASPSAKSTRQTCRIYQHTL